MMEWQPIETAPKDGTWVLLVVPTVPVTIGAFEPSLSIGDSASERTGESDWFDLSGENLSGDMAPIHWMPLPEPPEAA